MSLFVMFMIWYNIFGKSNPKIYRNLENKIGKIFGTLILFSVFSSFIPSFLIGSFVVLISLAIMFAPLYFLYRFLKSIIKSGDGNNQKANYTYNQNTAAQTNSYAGNYNSKNGKEMSATGLTKSVPKRKKILQKFNDKYKLTLTESEMDRIVDASYMSLFWEKEIYDMDCSYDSIYEWYRGNTGWLRAYLRAFSVQSVSSDFEMQKKICIDSFDQIFREINPGRFATTDECVETINNRFLTFFDESTFMMAYRFLEANGRNYDLPNSGIVRNESDLEKLQRKYDQDQGEGERLYTRSL